MLCWIFEVSICYSIMCWDIGIHPGFGPGSIEESITTRTLAVWWMLFGNLWLSPALRIYPEILSTECTSRLDYNKILTSCVLLIPAGCEEQPLDCLWPWAQSFELSIVIKLLLSLPQVYRLGNPRMTSLVHCSVPFGSFFLLSLYLNGSLCSSSVGVESCLLPPIRIKPCQVFNTSVVTPPWLLVYKGAHTLT